MSVAESWAQRMLRVWRGVAPRGNFWAPPRTSTEAPERRALIAAHSAALPPPITSTSNFRIKSTIALVIVICAADAIGRGRLHYAWRAGGYAGGGLSTVRPPR